MGPSVSMALNQRRSAVKGWVLAGVVMFAVLVVLPPANGSVFAQTSVYRVSLTNPGPMGWLSNCSLEGYVLARPGGTSQLQADGTDLDVDLSPGPPLMLRLLTNVVWTRKYDAGRGISGVFDGTRCYGATTGSQGYSGNLFIFLENKKGQSTVRFIWHFDYYLTADNNIREHFTLTSDSIPFPAWTGGDVSGRVSGRFDLQYYLKEGRRVVSKYQSLTGGQGRFFDFDLTIVKIR